MIYFKSFKQSNSCTELQLVMLGPSFLSAFSCKPKILLIFHVKPGMGIQECMLPQVQGITSQHQETLMPHRGSGGAEERMLIPMIYISRWGTGKRASSWEAGQSPVLSLSSHQNHQRKKPGYLPVLFGNASLLWRHLFPSCSSARNP